MKQIKSDTYRTLICLIGMLMIVACETKSTIRMGDLDMGDYESKWIKENKIQATVRFYRDEQGLWSDSIVYNLAGRKIYEANRIRVIETVYDQNGLPVIRKIVEGPNVIPDTITYNYDDKQKTLRQSSSINSDYYIYTFDNLGKVRQRRKYADSGKNQKAQLDYIYSPQGQLIEIESQIFTNQPLKLVGSTNIYYSERGKIDSVVFESSTQKTTRTYYDKHGLAEKEYYGAELVATFKHFK